MEGITTDTTSIAAEIWQECFAPIFADIDRQIAELHELKNPFEDE